MYGYGPPQALATIRELCNHGSYRTVLYVHEYKLTRNDFMQEKARTVANGELVNVRGPAKGFSTPMEPPWLGQRLRLLALREMLSSHGLGSASDLRKLARPREFRRGILPYALCRNGGRSQFPS
jgi:hypothetical protein